MPPPEIDLATIAARRGLNRRVALESGEFLFREGDEPDALYIVVRGTLRIISGSTVYEIVRAGGIVGEMAIVDKGMPRSASVIAGPYTELIKLDPADFAVLVTEVPDFALMVMRVMVRRLRQMNNRFRPQTSWR